jgi:hypothetical protein
MILHLSAQKFPKKDISKKGRPAIKGNFLQLPQIAIMRITIYSRG